MIRWGSTAIVSLLVSACAAPMPRVDAAPPPVRAPADQTDYRADAAWLCLPGRDDACGQPLPTVALSANGYGSNGIVRASRDAAVDCFYVYPTVSRDAGILSDRQAGIEERGAAIAQFARFGTVCRTYAPIYRQLTLASLRRLDDPAATGAIAGGLVTAYADVLAAWRQFLADRNDGRPFVLIGHSQGAIHLQRLIREEIEGKPDARRMLSAILLGWNVEVPVGRRTGGSFRTTPLCSRIGETGCVIAYTSFRTTPPAGAMFGRAVAPGNTVACTNPATLAAGPAPLDSYWFVPATTATPIRWSSEGAPPAPFVRTEGLVTGRCVNDGSVGYLELTAAATPGDRRTDDFPGDVAIGGRIDPAWGTHLADMPVAQGDLIRLVEAQAETVRR